MPVLAVFLSPESSPVHAPGSLGAALLLLGSHLTDA